MAGIWRVSGQKNPFKSVHFFWPIHDVAFSIFLPAPTTSGLTRVSNLMLHLAVARWKTSWELPRSQVMPQSSARATTVEPWWSMVSYMEVPHTHTHTHTHTHLLRTVIANSVVERIWRAKPDRNRRVFGGVKGKFFRRHPEEWNKINRSQEEPHNISRKLQWTRDSPQPQSVSFV